MTSATLTAIINGRYRSIYVHGDGYPEHTGKMLVKYYSDPASVKALLDLGDLSFVDKLNTAPAGQKHSFNEPAKDTTIAYSRDRGERLRASSALTYEDSASSYNTNYYYFYKDGTWLVSKTYTENSLIPVIDYLRYHGDTETVTPYKEPAINPEVKDKTQTSESIEKATKLERQALNLVNSLLETSSVEMTYYEILNNTAEYVHPKDAIYLRRLAALIANDKSKEALNYINRQLDTVRRDEGREGLLPKGLLRWLQHKAKEMSS